MSKPQKQGVQIRKRIYIPIYESEIPLELAEELKKAKEEQNLKYYPFPEDYPKDTAFCPECERERQAALYCNCGEYQCEECLKEQREKEGNDKEGNDKEGNENDKKEQNENPEEEANKEKLGSAEQNQEDECLPECTSCQKKIKKDEIIYRNKDWNNFCSPECRAKFNEENQIEF